MAELGGVSLYSDFPVEDGVKYMHQDDLKEMYRIGLIVEYSRMKVPSFSRGCEIAPFFVLYMAESATFLLARVASVRLAPQCV